MGAPGYCSEFREELVLSPQGTHSLVRGCDWVLRKTEVLQHGGSGESDMVGLGSQEASHTFGQGICHIIICV